MRSSVSDSRSSIEHRAFRAIGGAKPKKIQSNTYERSMMGLEMGTGAEGTKSSVVADPGSTNSQP